MWAGLFICWASWDCNGNKAQFVSVIYVAKLSLMQESIKLLMTILESRWPSDIKIESL